jgi:hypothetical protein
MRTTVTLDADAEAAVRALMRERGLTFKQALNESIRRGVRREAIDAFRTPTFDLGTARLPLDKALRLAADLEDDELIRRLAARK